MAVEIDPLQEEDQSLEVDIKSIAVVDRPLEERLDYETGKELHTKILDKLKARRDYSVEHCEERYDEWNRVRKHLKLYIDLSDKARLGDKSTDESVLEMPFQRSVSIPVSYANLHVLLTQMVSIFSARSPIIQLSGRGPEDVFRAKMMEVLLAYDNQQSKAFTALYSMLQDAIAFGTGITYDSWEIDEGVKFDYQPLTVPGVPPELLVAYLGPMAYTPVRTIGVRREFNRWKPVDPFKFRPDPRVAFWNLQEGEFCGHAYEVGYNALKKKELPRGPYFNLKHVPKHAKGLGRRYEKLEDVGMNQTDTDLTTRDQKDRGFFEAEAMVVELIPKEWEIGDSEFPEKYIFTWIGDEVIVRAHEMPNVHQQFPYSAAESDPEFHTTWSPGIIELLEPMQRYINWLFNCYSEDTEVLTSDGWMNVGQVGMENRVATIDPQTMALAFEKPKRLFAYDGPDRMVRFQNQQIDCLVTPNHKMLVEGAGGLEFVEAADLVGKRSVMRRGGLRWNCVPAQPLVLEARPPLRDRGAEPHWQRAEITPEQLAALVGWFVSEGNLNRHAICLVQRADRHADDIDRALAEFPLHVGRHERNSVVRWHITDRRLAGWISEQCYVGDIHDCTGKMIPPHMKEWEPRLLQILFDAAMAGDGSYSKPHPNIGTYTSCSRQLVDDMQEIALKLGYAANIVEAGQTSSGKAHWRLNINTQGERIIIKPEDIHLERYSGKVYCFENSTHCTVVRRNGKPILAGQSHIESITSVLNNQYIYSPRFIERHDLEYGGPGRHIRLKNEAVDMMLSGEVQDVRQFLFQMPVQDVTGPSYMNAVQYLYQMVQLLSGANDPMSGIQLPTERSATEVHTITAKASDRIAILAKLVDENAIQPLVQRSILNRQQLTQIQQYYRILGEFAEEYGADSIFIELRDLQGEFDYIPISGIMPEDPSRSAQAWSQIMAAAAQNPALQQPGPDGKQLDFRKVFDTIAQKMGITNIGRYYMNVNVVPDEQAMAQEQAGNYVPVQVPSSGMLPPGG